MAGEANEQMVKDSASLPEGQETFEGVSGGAGEASLGIVMGEGRGSEGISGNETAQSLISRLMVRNNDGGDDVLQLASGRDDEGGDGDSGSLGSDVEGCDESSGEWFLNLIAKRRRQLKINEERKRRRHLKRKKRYVR